MLRLLGLPGPEPLGRGLWVVTTQEHAKVVLSDVATYDFPLDSSRQPLSEPEPGSLTGRRSPHSITPPLTGDAVTRGETVLVDQLRAVTAGFRAGSEFEAMQLLRAPVARSAVAAVLPGVGEADRDRIGDLVLGWVDALAPVIGASRNPSRWSRVRRREAGTRQALEDALAAAGCPDPAATGTVLAAGTQVPIAAGSWLFVKLAEYPDVHAALRARPELVRAVVWETLRLCPPTWITGRITTRRARLGEVDLPDGAVVMVSPLLLGRLDSLAPGEAQGAQPLDRFDPLRWDQDRVRPGAWLPFGAGPHACPGRSLGLAQLTRLAEWAAGFAMEPIRPVMIDQSRGIFPRPSGLRLTASGADKGG